MRLLFFICIFCMLPGMVFSQILLLHHHNHHHHDHGRPGNNNKRVLEVGLGAILMPASVGTMSGLAGNLSLYSFKKHFLIGAGISFSEGNTNTSFTYQKSNLRLNIIDIERIYEYRFYDKHFLKVGLGVVPAITVIDLRDPNPETGNKSAHNAPQTLSQNVYFSIRPGLNVYVPLFGKKNQFGLYLQTNYRFLAGQSNFGKPCDFGGFYCQAGIRWKIVTH